MQVGLGYGNAGVCKLVWKCPPFFGVAGRELVQERFVSLTDICCLQQEEAIQAIWLPSLATDAMANAGTGRKV